MNNVGKELKSSRISKKISILNVSKELNISKEIIEMIENNQMNERFNKVFWIGHLRSYCNFLELDSDKAIEIFKKRTNFLKDDNKYKLAKPTFENSASKFTNFIPATLSILIFTSFYLLFVREDNITREYALVPDLPEIYVPIVEHGDMSKPKNNSINNSENNIVKDDFSYTSAIASNKINTDLSSDTVTLKLLNPTWLQVRDSLDNIILSKLMDKGEEYSYKADRKYNITAGNAGNILVIINQDVIGKIGKFGQVVDSIVINKNFNN